MRLDELLEAGIKTGEIQATILSAMMDNDDFVQLSWVPFTKTAGYELMDHDPAFKQNMNRIFQRYMNSGLDDLLTVSTALNQQNKVFKIIKFIQQNAEDKRSINPSSFNLQIENYRIEKASVFKWNGIIFMVIKDVIPPGQRNYHIYAATDHNY